MAEAAPCARKGNLLFHRILAEASALEARARGGFPLLFRARSLVVSGALGFSAVLAGVSIASAEDPPQSPAAVTPPAAIENYEYPGASRILTERGIKLKKGDGRILLAECDQAAQQIRVLTVADDSVGREGTYCFKALGKAGNLTLELPRVFMVQAADHPFSADLTANGATTTVNVAKDKTVSVGEAAPGGARSVLVELRVTG
ncbi:hypothetical protein PV396_26790 [Streptomyces sp. ME02-8801-2C]|uniref:hypothetical protein n=1 Tax=Streptomyces sp. ME02-8801-2C TaxID=3028680 RepID=UPI0029A08A19|nr:hypothetical protein [Streptomyces sp. ME02-8801-2C]MDX3455500.1 hypothetical protein [Streptomyces sp. ME02-8801-2C]